MDKDKELEMLRGFVKKEVDALRKDFKITDTVDRNIVEELQSKLFSSIPKTALLTEERIEQLLIDNLGGDSWCDFNGTAKALVQAQQAKIEGAK